jgi:NADH dehydrogenase
MSRRVVVTGAFGYSGRAVTERLLARGDEVRTLTGLPLAASPFGDRVAAAPFHFDDPFALAASLEGAEVLVNTYWVRFEHGEATYARAVENTLSLFAAARAAGVRRVVHVSIANPSAASPLPYYSGKAALERSLSESGLSYAIVRPTVLFGGSDVLVNNIAFLLRRLPLFGVPGRGRYRIRPVHVGDFADLIVAQSSGRENVVLDAVGPECFRYVEFVRRIRDAVGSHTPVLPAPKSLVWLAGRVAGRFLNDIVLTWPEIRGLTAGLLATEGRPTAPTRFTDWLGAHADELGRHYASELARHWRPGPHPGSWPDGAAVSGTGSRPAGGDQGGNEHQRGQGAGDQAADHRDREGPEDLRADGGAEGDRQ